METCVKNLGAMKQAFRQGCKYVHHNPMRLRGVKSTMDPETGYGLP